jgi:hypothetical protein
LPSRILLVNQFAKPILKHSVNSFAALTKQPPEATDCLEA